VLFNWVSTVNSLPLFTESPVRRRRHSNEMETVRPASIGEEELQLQLALAMSREEHEEELRKQKSDDIKLQMALDESRRQVDDVSCQYSVFSC